MNNPEGLERNPRKQRSPSRRYLFGIITLIIFVLGGALITLNFPDALSTHRKNCSANLNAKDNDRIGKTPLLKATIDGHVDRVQLLLDCGADVNAKANDGITPLYVASGWGHVDVARLLLDRGADVNAKGNDGRTPLYWANYSSQTDVARLLRSRGGHE